MIDQLKQQLQDLQLKTFNYLSDLSIDNTEITTLYEQRRFIKFKLHNYIKDGKLILPSEEEILLDYQAYIKASKSRTSLKQRIKKKIYLMNYPAFITITFTDHNLEINYKNELRKLFKKYGINNYTLLTDYGRRTGRLHFHGFIDLANLDMELFTCHLSIKKDQAKHYYSFIPLERFGLNFISFYNNMNAMVNYATKYMVKDYRLKHESFNSRSGLIRTKEQFKYANFNYIKILKKNKNFFSFER
jgi:hypothetical protein